MVLKVPDADYLFQSAVAYGKQHNLEKSVRQLYSIQPAHTTHPTKFKMHKKIENISQREAKKEEIEINSRKGESMIDLIFSNEKEKTKDRNEIESSNVTKITEN